MKKICCRRAFILGALYFGAEVCDAQIALYGNGAENGGALVRLISEQFGRETAPEKVGRDRFLLSFSSNSAAKWLAQPDLHEIIKCGDCTASFLRGGFLCGGTVNGPENKNYHLELCPRTERDLSVVAALCEKAGISLRMSRRLGKPTLYCKDSNQIGDFLFYIGATRQAFAFTNAKLEHELKNDINRRTNCDAGNIARSTASAAKHLAAIRYLADHGRLSELGPDLEYTANMRLAHPEMPLSQLGQEMSPQVSKPGLYHRLERITAYADKYRKKS